MKTTKRVLAALLTIALLTGLMTGCGSKGEEGNKKGGTSKTDIEISLWNSGLGTAWLDEMIKGFKKVHPEYNVYYNATSDLKAATTAYGMADVDTIDLYLSTKIFDTGYMEPLDDLLNSTADGDSKPLIDKFDDSYIALEKTSDGKIYSLTYGGGVVGIVYNKELFKKAGIDQLPRTTNELATVCNDLFTQDIIPICHFKEGGYWQFVEECWYGQYEGTDYYLNTFYGNPTKDTMLAKDGRYEILKAMEKIITPDYVLSGSNSSDHTTIQTNFVLGQAAMMVSGSWLANEMKASGEVKNFVTMKLPVLSGITNKLTTVKKESELRKVIDAIDAVTDGEAELSTYQQGADYQVEGISVSAADWDYLYKARNTVPNNYAGHAAYIPTYSNAKEGAKEFLKYLYSDAGYKIFLDTLHIELPMQLSSGELDTSKWNDFEIGQSKLMKTSVQSFTSFNRSQHALFINGGAKLFAGVSYIEKFCTRNESDRKTADQVWKQVTNSVEDNFEATWWANIQ